MGGQKSLATVLFSWGLMSANSPPPPHRIGILMSPVGRFLECTDCKRSFIFPEDALFDAVAKQFESHPCGSPVRIPDWRAADIMTLPNRSERRFVILRYDGRVPAMASCVKCDRKFFTPATFARDAIGAEEYLGQKFDAHQCNGSD
jgi:hypothetical protein